jgi:hypothetical protein
VLCRSEVAPPPLWPSRAAVFRTSNTGGELGYRTDGTRGSGIIR